MKERPILFSGAMVRAILDGYKTQTRRVIKMPRNWDCFVCADWGDGWWPYRSDDGETPTYDNNEIPLNCPYGQRGNRLWVRETHRPIYGQTCGLIDVDYQADSPEKWTRLGDEIGTPLKWTPSIHMLREHSRIQLRITSVRVERLQDISEADALAEGISIVRTKEWDLKHFPAWRKDFDDARDRGDRPPVGPLPSECYRALWESLSGAGSWKANPWVWVIEFEKDTA